MGMLALQVNMSPSLYRLDMPPEGQLLLRTLIHDVIQLKGLGPGGLYHDFTPTGLLNLTFHPHSVAVGEAACAGQCGTKQQCKLDEACMLCRSCRSDWQNLLLQRVVAEHSGECTVSFIAAGVSWVLLEGRCDVYAL